MVVSNLNVVTPNFASLTLRFFLQKVIVTLTYIFYHEHCTFVVLILLCWDMCAVYRVNF